MSDTILYIYIEMILDYHIHVFVLSFLKSVLNLWMSSASVLANSDSSDHLGADPHQIGRTFRPRKR